MFKKLNQYVIEWESSFTIRLTHRFNKNIFFMLGILSDCAAPLHHGSDGSR